MQLAFPGETLPAVLQYGQAVERQKAVEAQPDGAEEEENAATSLAPASCSIPAPDASMGSPTTLETHRLPT